MASSSTSSIYKSFKYEAFLSFRGEDTRTNFVDHLYRALQEEGIYTYKDEERITKGKRITDELISSIQDSKFYIIVFSKNYASSSWCLDELVNIMECHKTTEHTAYPIFYDVEPTEVRKQSGAVGEAFSTHEKEEDARKWREALKEAADLAGWELKNSANGHEAKFIEKIVKEISLQINSISFSFDEKLVGLETRVNDVISSLETSIDDVRMIGIKGMGGAGKTTLARAVFDQISSRFKGKSFVENVREVSNSSLSGLMSLQNKVLSDVLNDKDISVSSVHDGKKMMKRRMRGKKVVIVLDDVDDINQLEALAGEPNWFKPESIIIITSRDEKVLVAHRVTLIHDVNLLSDKEAICLFSRYAFGREIPSEDYEELSEQVVCYAAGLPLTIKVLGSFLCGDDKPIWEDALQRLKKIPLAKTQEILELSYIVLEDDYKEIFLDVACILKGWEINTAIEALESCGFHARIGLRTLQQKSLITIKGSPEYKHVDMHDSIEEMGKNIVRRSHPGMPEKHSRLWKDDEIEHILANGLGTVETRCIQFETNNPDPSILIKGLGKMKALRYLSMVMNDRFTNLELNTYSPSFPEALGYLCLHGYPFNSLPITFEANKLVTLILHDSKIVQLWEGGERKVLKKLRFLELRFLKLRTLDLGFATNVERLHIRGCLDLVELPDAIWMLQHLRSLELYDCLFLEKLPENIGQLRCLEELGLSSISIKHLPDSICMLKYLKHLRLMDCKLLEKLPKDIGQMKCLKILEVVRTPITNLPDSIVMLKDLNTLYLFSCLSFEKLPEDLGLLQGLKELTLTYTNIKHLPDSISMLKHLRTLVLDHCSFLEQLPKDLGQLECLERIDLSFTNIKHLPDSISMLKCLHSLELRGVLLKKLPEDFGGLVDCLRQLHLSCTTIEHLPHGIFMLKHLNSLKLIDCPSIKELPEGISRLECLKSLYLSKAKIKHLPNSICMLKHLESLKLDHCSLLENLPEDLGHLECLKELTLSYTRITHLPGSVCMLKHLYVLHLTKCMSLEKLPEALGQLGGLEWLLLSYTKIRHLPDSVCKLKHLATLKLDHCSLLEQLPKDLGRLKCLWELSLSYSKIRHLPDSICKLKHLRYIYLDECLLFQKLPDDLGLLEYLKVLHIGGTCITHLPQSILLLKGLSIFGSRELLQSFGFTFKIRYLEMHKVSYVEI